MVSYWRYIRVEVRPRRFDSCCSPLFPKAVFSNILFFFFLFHDVSATYPGSALRTGVQDACHFYSFLFIFSSGSFISPRKGVEARFFFFTTPRDDTFVVLCKRYRMSGYEIRHSATTYENASLGESGLGY